MKFVGQAFLPADVDSTGAASKNACPTIVGTTRKLVGQALPLAGLAGRNPRPTIAVTRARARQCAARKKTIAATTTLKMPRKASIRRWSGVA